MRKGLAAYLKDRGVMAVCGMDEGQLDALSYEIEKTYLAEYLMGMIVAIEDVMSISPFLDWRDILESGVEKIVKALGGDAGTIRLFEPESGEMVSFGSFMFREKERKQRVSMENSISGIVARSEKSYTVPNILKEPLYRDKDVATTLNLNSLIAVPLIIPPFIETESEIRGTLQIYYRENDRRFDPLEVTHAEVLARRISHVVARKRILDLSQLNLHKEKLVEKIFLKLSKREGVKMRELFGLMIPELVDIIQIQSCALFSVGEDRETVRLEMGYPEGLVMGDGGKTLPVSESPYLQMLVSGSMTTRHTEADRVAASYLLIRDPENSILSNRRLASFMASQGSRSMLAVPLSADGVVHFFMLFFAAEQAREFSGRDIELLTFFGKEVMKALRIERLDDLLHDFKNPVVAVGGFTRRLAKIARAEDLNSVRAEMQQILDIVVEETARMEKVMRSTALEGRERPVDLGAMLSRRFRINAEAVRENMGDSIRLDLGQVAPHLTVRCIPHDLERSVDNLLLNARDAVPPGGAIRASCGRDGETAWLEVRNTGEIAEEVLSELRSGEVAGRGLNIVRRFVKETRGRLDIFSEAGETVFRITLPLHRG